MVDYQLINKISSMITKDQVTEIFCVIDEHYIEFDACMASCSIGRRAARKPKLSSSEVTTIMVLFQLSEIRCFKWFYSQYLAKHMLQEFPNFVSYN